MFESVEQLNGEDVVGWYFFNGLMGVLYLLHLYWYFMFLKMGWHFVKKGETRDMQANLTAMDLQKLKGGGKKDQ